MNPTTDNKRILAIKAKIKSIESACDEVIKRMAYYDIIIATSLVSDIFEEKYDYAEFLHLYEAAKVNVLMSLELKIKELSKLEKQ